jgi:transposase InsO family protein
MDIHKNARLTVHGRARIVGLLQNGYGVAEAAEMSGVTGKTVRKWRDRFRAEGPAGLQDRSSRPHQPRHPTPIETVQQIEALRRQRMPGKEIAAQVGVSPSTVSRVLQRLGLNKLSALEPAQPTRRYERERPGELIHIDIKKLGRFDKAGHRAYGERREEWRNRGAGWEFVHVAIDDASRIAFSRIMKSERKACAVAFLKAMVAYYKSLGIAVEQVMTDNGACYRARAFRTACKRLGLRHIYTRPYTPRTNGKAERFIQTALREWAYAKAYDTSRQRAADLPIWLHRYNWHRPHGSIRYKPPVSKLGLAEDNLLRLHS